MNKEEIDELLDKLDRDEWCTDLYKVPLTWCELYDIRDYINSLQQENKQLKEEIKAYQDMYFDNVMIINKAIEYNEHLIRYAKYHLNFGHLKRMRKILKGDSNENN